MDVVILIKEFFQIQSYISGSKPLNIFRLLLKLNHRNKAGKAKRLPTACQINLYRLLQCSIDIYNRSTFDEALYVNLSRAGEFYGQVLVLISSWENHKFEQESNYDGLN